MRTVDRRDDSLIVKASEVHIYLRHDNQKMTRELLRNLL